MKKWFILIALMATMTNVSYAEAPDFTAWFKNYQSNDFPSKHMLGTQMYAAPEIVAEAKREGITPKALWLKVIAASAFDPVQYANDQEASAKASEEEKKHDQLMADINASNQRQELQNSLDDLARTQSNISSEMQGIQSSIDAQASKFHQDMNDAAQSYRNRMFLGPH